MTSSCAATSHASSLWLQLIAYTTGYQRKDLPLSSTVLQLALAQIQLRLLTPCSFSVSSSLFLVSYHDSDVPVLACRPGQAHATGRHTLGQFALQALANAIVAAVL